MAIATNLYLKLRYQCKTEKGYAKLLMDVCDFLYKGNMGELERDLQKHLEVNGEHMGIDSKIRAKQDLYRISQMKEKQTAAST